jgi:hypothetical protein
MSRLQIVEQLYTFIFRNSLIVAYLNLKDFRIWFTGKHSPMLVAVTTPQI